MEQARPKMEETRQECETRSKEGFPEAEATLPKHIGSRLNIPALDNVSSLLGSRNPLAQAVDPAKECVWLLDNTAYRPVHIYHHTPQPFQAEFIAAYFVHNSGKDVSKWVGEIADKLGLRGDAQQGKASNAAAEQTIAKRLQPFVDTIQPARWVDIKFPNGDIQRLGPGGKDAISHQVLSTQLTHRDSESLSIDTVPPGLSIPGPMLTHFAEPEGWMVISDIDDSIKITMTPSPVGILQTTFVDNPTPIAGMPALYSTINTTLSPVWFYLSASPYNLYTFLRPFLHANYPPGTIVLRDASWMDLSGFLASLTQGTEAYKSERMERFHRWLPRRKVLCVGDSTQSDPEAYGDVYRLWPGWVRKVFIRKVTDVSEMKGTDKNDDSRFEKAFRDVPRDVWQTFEDPKELYQAVEALRGT
ncbi:hypothetical protein MMC20_004210 [Loxospora ochrophaea]|nr:hypothetical protein [Loxospora ochrophaea]